MKQGISFVLQVNFDFDLDLVERIEFLFVQNNVSVGFEYPSENAHRLEGKNTIHLLWTPEQTYKFKARETLEMDTRMHLINAVTNPETPVVKMKFNRTLFKEGVNV